MAGEDGVDWNLVDIRLAIADTPEGKTRRDQLFRHLDPNCNRTLSLSEVQAGLGSQLETDSRLRPAGAAAESIIPGISDFRLAIKAAFNNARHLGKSSNKRDDDTVDRTEFHALLVFFRQYLELLVVFKNLDTNGDMNLTIMEIMPAISRLRKWDITAAKVMQKINMEPGGKMPFNRFAEWCLNGKLESLTFDELEGAPPSPAAAPAASAGAAASAAGDPASAATAQATPASPSSAQAPSAAQAGKGKVDWALVDQRIPTDPGAKCRAERKELFKKMDVTGSGHVTLAEVQTGVNWLLERDHSQRKKGEAAESIIPCIRDTRPAATCAFRACMDLAPPDDDKRRNVQKYKRQGDDSVDLREFHAFLVYLRHYLELQVLFQDVDTSENSRISKTECECALPFLAKWGIDQAAVNKKFKVSSSLKGELKFTHFADWCIRLGLAGHPYDSLEDDHNDAGVSGTNKVAVDWSVVDQKIPTDPGSEAYAERNVLFNNMDATGGGNLSLADVITGVSRLLEGVPGIADTGKAVRCAFRAARDLAPPQGRTSTARKGKRQGDNSVDRREFHAFLVYLREYLELRLLFEDLDASDDNRISEKECRRALLRLERSGIDDDAVQKKFSKEGDMKFSEFADWCIRIKLHEHPFDALEDDPDDEDDVCDMSNEQRPDSPGIRSVIFEDEAAQMVHSVMAEEVEELPAATLGPFDMPRAATVEELPKLAETGEMTRTRLPQLSKSCSSLPMGSAGVLQRAPHLKHLSHVRSLPKWRFGEKRPSSFFVTNSNPAPGSYQLTRPERTSKFRESSASSFGGGRRFDNDHHPGKLCPAPGQYGIPKNPAEGSLARAVGFSKMKRGPRSQTEVRGSGPGPGSYEHHSTLGGKTCTAKGKAYRAYNPTSALPGPGAYHPSVPGCLTHEKAFAQIGFGTGPARDHFWAFHSAAAPGPGAYEHDTWKPMGKDTNKFSFRSRTRCASSFNSYITPGPGTYDGDGTCFGY